MSNNHTPKEPIPPNNYMTRDRPLQKSMFLPEHLPPTAPHPPNSNESSFNPLKRSLIESSPAQNQGGQYQFRTNPNHSLSIHTFQPPKATHAPFNLIQTRSGSQHELLHHSNSTSNIKHSSSASNPIDFEPKSFTKLEKGKASFVQIPQNQNQNHTHNHSHIAHQVATLIKDKHLPALISTVKNQIFEQLGHIKQQFINFKEEVKLNRNKQDMINSDLKVQLGSNRGSQGLIQGRKSIDSDKDKEISQLQKDFFLLQGKIKQIESSFNDKFVQFGKQIEKLSMKTIQQQQKGFSVNPIKSTLSPILLEYKQLFSFKPTGEVHKRVSGHEDIVISQCHYYIDKNGFLMDSESRYIVDRKGIQIRLDQKHIKILQRHKILR